MKRTTFCLSLVAAFAVAACSQPVSEPAQDTSDADSAAIRANTDRFLAAFNAADVDGVMSLIASDAVEMPPDEPTYEGSDAIRQSMTEFFDEFDATQTATTEEASAFGDVGYARGTWSVTQTPKAGGDTVERNGKWFVIHQRQDDGSWKTWRWMWNENRAVDEAEEEAGG